MTYDSLLSSGLEPNEKTRSALGWSLAFPGGMFIHYLLANYLDWYRIWISKYLLLFFAMWAIYTFVIYRFVEKKYTDEKILKINSKYENKLSPSAVKFLFVLYFFCNFITIIVLIVLLMFAVANKPVLLKA